MKRWLALIIMAAMLTSFALAEGIVGYEYTDGATAKTHDSVVDLFMNKEGFIIDTLEPDEISMALLESVYEFIYKEQNRPARYYDEETQQKIAELTDVDIDILHLTEIMRLILDDETVPAEETKAEEPPIVQEDENESEVTATMRLDVDYAVDQLVVVVLCVPDENEEYDWYAYRGRVETVGEIKWDMPMEEWNEYAGEPISFHVLTDRIGGRGGGVWREERIKEPKSVFSKDSGDVYTVRRWYDANNEPITDDFRLYLTDLVVDMENEVERIGEHVKEGNAVIEYFPEERIDEARLMLPEDIPSEELIAYDVIALYSENYRDTNGDVSAEITFATEYDPEKAMIVFAGFPVKDTEKEFHFEWFVLRAEAMEDLGAVEIGFKQLNLERMEDEPIMLVVISERLVKEIPEDEGAEEKTAG